MYDTLASLRSLGQGERDQRPGWYLGGTPPLSALDFSCCLSKPHPWLYPGIPSGT